MTTIDVNSLLLQMRRISAQTEMPAIRGVGGEAAPVAKGSFGDVLKQSIDGVAKTQEKAGQMAAAFERGDPGIDLAQVMIQGQKADLSFRAMTEVRNKMVDAYKEIMNMSL
ncbi:MAG: flagellar hook-basal body complex protein FliE [Luteibacter sp.]